MAVRDVYRRKDLKDVVEERRVASLAADAAPKNAALMARANALWLVAKPGIEWNERKGAAAAAARTASMNAGESEIQQRNAASAAAAAFVAANPEPPLVKWNVAVPKTKKYNDPLYADVENDPDFNGWLDGEQPVAAPAPAPAPAPAAAGYNAPRPDVPANAAQLGWNRRLLNDFAGKIIPLHDPEKQEEIETLLMIASAEIEEIPAHGIDVININLANALLVYTVCELPVNKRTEKFVIESLAEAIILGGDRIKNGLAPDFDLPVYINRLVILKNAIKAKVNERLAAAPAPAAPAPAAPAPAVNALEADALAHFAGLGDGLEGGKRSDNKRSDKRRKTYKRRTGIPKKKTRATRRNN